MHTADCGLPLVNRNVKLNYSSTQKGSVLILTCEDEVLNMNISDKEILNVTCHSNRSWIPDPADFIQSCSPFITVTNVSPTPGTYIIIGSYIYSMLINYLEGGLFHCH